MTVTSASLPLFGCPPSGKVFDSSLLFTSQNGVRLVDVTRHTDQMLFIDTLSAKHFQLKTSPKTEATLSDQSIIF